MFNPLEYSPFSLKEYASDMSGNDRFKTWYRSLPIITPFGAAFVFILEHMLIVAPNKSSVIEEEGLGDFDSTVISTDPIVNEW